MQVITKSGRVEREGGRGREGEGFSVGRVGMMVMKGDKGVRECGWKREHHSSSKVAALCGDATTDLSFSAIKEVVVQETTIVNGVCLSSETKENKDRMNAEACIYPLGQRDTLGTQCHQINRHSLQIDR